MTGLGYRTGAEMYRPHSEEALVREIRRLADEGWTLAAIAQTFRLHPRAVRAALDTPEEVGCCRQ